MSVLAPLAVPIAWFPNARGDGLTVNVRVAAAPVPLRETGEPATAPLVAVIVAVPVKATAVAGENTTLIVQLAPAARVPVQVPPAPPPGRENGTGLAEGVDAKATPIPVAAPFPVLDNVKVSAALVVPTTVLGKLSEVGLTLRVGDVVGKPWYSIAPMSNALWLEGSGRAFPKKSVLGCA